MAADLHSYKLSFNGQPQFRYFLLSLIALARTELTKGNLNYCYFLELIITHACLSSKLVFKVLTNHNFGGCYKYCVLLCDFIFFVEFHVKGSKCLVDSMCRQATATQKNLVKAQYTTCIYFVP